MTHLKAFAKRSNVVHSGNHANPDDLMATLRDDSDRRSAGSGGVNGAWLGHVGENGRRRKSSKVRPVSSGMLRAIRFAVPWAGAGNLWIGILIGAAMAGLVLAMT
jgi:hypothetical protein